VIPGIVYVAGPMTGRPEFNFPLFNLTAARLLGMGWLVENPADNGGDTTLAWDYYMREGIKQLVKCTSIALLPEWEQSRGARLELRIAIALDLDVYLVYPNEPDDADVLARMTHVEMLGLLNAAEAAAA